MKALLEKLQEVTPEFNQEDCNKAFQEIAEILLNDYAIQIHDRIVILLRFILAKTPNVIGLR